MHDDIVSALLRRRDTLVNKSHQYREALVDILELVDGYADVDDGQPNLAMRIQVVAQLALEKK